MRIKLKIHIQDERNGLKKMSNEHEKYVINSLALFARVTRLDYL